MGEVIRFLSDPVFDACTITTTGCTTEYPASNIVNRVLEDFARTNTGAGPHTIKFDAGAGNTVSLNVCPLFRFKAFDSSDVDVSSSVKVKLHKSNNDADWTLVNADADGFVWHKRNLIEYFAATHTARYFRLQFESPNGNFYAEVGRVYPDVYFQPDQNLVKGWKRGHGSRSVPSDAESGTQYGLVRSIFRWFEIAFRANPGADIAEIVDIYHELGILGELVVSLRPLTDLNETTMYGHMVGNLIEGSMLGTRKSASMLIKECL